MLPIDERVDVISLFKVSGGCVPVKVKWNNRIYPITSVGYHHTKREGSILIHCYAVVSGQTAMRLSLHSETLSWTLEGVMEVV